MAGRPGSLFRNFTPGKGQNSSTRSNSWLMISRVSGKYAVTAIQPIRGRKTGSRNFRSQNGASGSSDMHGNAARVAESEAGAERMNAEILKAETVAAVSDRRQLLIVQSAYRISSRAC